jgi:hypothetical protein
VSQTGIPDRNMRRKEKTLSSDYCTKNKNEKRPEEKIGENQ